MCIIIYSFVCQYSLRYYWYCSNQNQSFGTVLQKRCSYKFCKIDKKTLKKEILEQMFSCELWEISHNIFFKETFGQLLHHKHSFCLLSHHDILPFQKQCHTYFLPEYFFGLTCRLETRASSIFQALSQKPISYSVEHLRCSYVFAKIVNSLKKLLSVFWKKASLWYSTRF